MSAQAGVWNFEGRPTDQAFLGKLSSGIEQFGPDGGDTYVDGPIGMVYRAFHSTPESRHERQPYKFGHGKVMTWDGRLDNRDELIPQVRKDLVAPQTDVATVASVFERWGTGCFHRLVGDWAMAVWIAEEQKLIFAVDYLAIRHIFYYLKEDRIGWSTDLASLVQLSGDKFHVDDEYIAGYFALDPEAHLTPYREIREVPPGHFVCIQHRTASVHRYWSFGAKACVRYKTDVEYEEHFRHVFRQAVRRRLRSESPVLAELSGGLDSSSIVCMADDILAKEEVATPRLDTLSFFDRTEPNGDDSIYFQKVEEQRGRAGAHIDFSRVGTCPAPLEYLQFAALPGNIGAGRQIEAERGAVVESGGYKAVLSGIGGDEFMGGIPDPRAHLADLIARFKIAELAKQLMAWSLVKRKPWIQLLLQSLMEFLPLSLRQYLVKEGKVAPWIERTFARRTRLAVKQLGPTELIGTGSPTRRSYLCGLLLMANKLAKFTPPSLRLEEIRYPYLDQTLIEFILSIPASQLLRPGERRSLMRRSLVDIVPPEILSRRTKQFGARTPVMALQKNWQEFQRVFDSPLSSTLGYVNKVRFFEACNGARSGKDTHLLRLLRTISLELWLRDLVARELIAPRRTSPQAFAGEPAQSGAQRHVQANC